mmetsp:Transcript_28608/g.62303  ORF Transcript_28608/g.62303 Transcript_28608/m.62303 type:complete len:261 (+) Transcript_28608:410-1192(+)
MIGKSSIETGVSSILNPWITRILVGAVATIFTLRYGAGIYAWKVANALEKPSYTILRRLSNGVELRRYEPYLIAETTVEKEGFRESTGDGFRSCAGYIFGNNKSGNGGDNNVSDDGSEKMAMTAPVRVSGKATTSSEKMAMASPVRVAGGTGKTKVSFVIGSKYSLKSVPRPLDRDVRLREVPGHVLAARTFNGPPPEDERVQMERNKIEDALVKADVKVSKKDGGETLVYGYHDPIVTPNLLRRNEVAVMVDPSSVGVE